MRILGIDWGEKRIGLAVADTSVPVAVPRGVEANDKKLMMKLVAFVAAEEVKQIVLGLPLTMAGEEGAMAARVRAFGGELAGAAGLPLAYVDERLSSRDAEKEAPQSKDAQAASVILQQWLDTQKKP